MLDVAIVGGGMCGLALARGLAARGVSFALFEARRRLGGRVVSVENPTTGHGLDLGPTWFWPQTQRSIVRLIDELGLTRFDQHDPGTALLMADPEEAPSVQSTPRLHGGAQRVEGGMAALVEALATFTPDAVLRLSHVLRVVENAGDHIILQFESDAGRSRVLARRVVLAVPPRLLTTNVTFMPPLRDELASTMQATPTWMASAAKAIIELPDEPVWRAFGHSGNAFVTHAQAVLGEVFDACDAAGEKAALGGFFAMAPDLRDQFRGGPPMLAKSQFVQLFGKALEAGELHLHDWSTQEFTCTEADRTFDGGHPDYGARALMQPVWADTLFFGASETAREGGGYVEGAINAAARIERQLFPRSPSAMSDIETTGAPALANQRCLKQFHDWVASRREPTFDAYRQRLNYALSHGARDQLTQRALLGAMEALFDDALAMIETLSFNHDDVGVTRARSDLTPQIQAAFEGFIQQSLDDVIAFNRTSCALSNFPAEHKPSKEYVSATLRDIAAAWRDFSLGANSRLLAKRRASADA